MKTKKCRCINIKKAKNWVRSFFVVFKIFSSILLYNRLTSFCHAFMWRHFVIRFSNDNCCVWRQMRKFQVINFWSMILWKWVDFDFLLLDSNKGGNCDVWSYLIEFLWSLGAQFVGWGSNSSIFAICLVNEAFPLLNLSNLNWFS